MCALKLSLSVTVPVLPESSWQMFVLRTARQKSASLQGVARSGADYNNAPYQKLSGTRGILLVPLTQICPVVEPLSAIVRRIVTAPSVRFIGRLMSSCSGASNHFVPDQHNY